MQEYFSRSSEETFDIGKTIGKTLQAPLVVSFLGGLGAGKTTLIKGIVLGAAGIDPNLVQSPTFTYLHLYEGRQKIYHFDLYRLSHAEAFFSMGFDEYLESDAISLIEWSEKIYAYLPLRRMEISLTPHQGDSRSIKICNQA